MKNNRKVFFGLENFRDKIEEVLIDNILVLAK